MKHKVTNKKLVSYVVRFMRKQGAPSYNHLLSLAVNVDEQGRRCAIACCFRNAKPGARQLTAFFAKAFDWKEYENQRVIELEQELDRQNRRNRELEQRLQNIREMTK